MPRWIDAEALPVRDLWVHDDSFAGRPVCGVLLEDLQKAEGVTPPQWIPVTPETLPPEDEMVLAIVNGKSGAAEYVDALELAEWNSEEGWLVWSCHDLRARVSYWLPIPKTPMEEE